jgi:hypothetical protein
MPEKYYDRDFPNLKRLGYKYTSDPAAYNCIAYAAGDETRSWWPNRYHPSEPSDDYWPIDNHQENVEAFTQALATRSFVLVTGDKGHLERWPCVLSIPLA